MITVAKDSCFDYGYIANEEKIAYVYYVKQTAPCKTLVMPHPDFFGCNEAVFCRSYGDERSRFIDCAKIVFPVGYTKIGARSLSLSPIKEIVLPMGIETIEGDAFAGSDLQSINLPPSLTYVERSAFEDTPIFRNDKHWIDGVFYLEDWALKCKPSSSFISIKEGTRGIGRAFMPHASFDQKRTPISLSLPKTLEIIESYAFYCSNIEKVTLPASLTSIGNAVFASSLIKEVEIGGVTEIGEGMFRSCHGLESIDLKSVTKVKTLAFAYCSNLRQVNMPMVECIEKKAFFEARKLNVVLPMSVKKVGERAFQNSATKILTLPNASYAQTAFHNTVLDELVVNSAVSQGIAGNAKSLTVNGVKTVRTGYCAGSDILEKVTLGDSVLLVRDDAFAMCPNLKEVRIFSEKTVLEPMAFYGSPVEIIKGGK